MATLPAFYVDNVRLFKSRTIEVRGAVISDMRGDDVVGIHVENCDTLRMKNNKVLRIRNGIGYEIQDCLDVVGVYNVASRMGTGYYFDTISALELYNLTAHNCSIGVDTHSDLTLYNGAFTTSHSHKSYGNAIGIRANGVSVAADYLMHYKLGSLTSGAAVALGSEVNKKHIVYKDEENDDLTPDYISFLINAGTENPIDNRNIDIGGIQTPVTSEVTTDFDYYYNLLDNTFWNVENEYAPEVSLVKSFQSMIAKLEVMASEFRDNLYVKFAKAMLRFSELFPAYMRYQSSTEHKKKIEDLWYATQNVGAVQSYQNAIGGYNLLPSFFKRIENVEDGWIIGESYVDEDNWLLGSEGQKYGIVIDVLGTSTISCGASGECYNNVLATTADIAPVKWALHHSPQPSGYVLFSDLWNGFEQCTLDNMVYNDDFGISPEQILNACEVVTPPISTISVGVSGGASGNVEISLLDRRYSENLTRNFYIREGASEPTMGAWEEIEIPIGGWVNLSANYVQFKVTVTGVLRKCDYEFRGIAMRPYTGETLFEET